MNYITTTQLRTQTSAFVEALLAGRQIELIHRSKKIGTLTLDPISKNKTNHSRLANNIAKLNLPFLTKHQMQNNYREYITTKYGQSLP